MKYLIFGDVHGNLPALEKMFKIENKNFDIPISHGDIVNYGPWSNESVDFLSEVPDLIALKGNHEIYFLNGIYPGQNSIAKNFFEFCYPKFNNQVKIEEYKKIFNLQNYRVQHSVDNIYFYPDSDLSKYSFDQNLILGHSHYQFNREVEGKRIVNTGSLGQNRKYINLAEYILYNEEKNEIELKSFEIPIDFLIQKMKQKKYPQICIDYYQKKKRT